MAPPGADEAAPLQAAWRPRGREAAPNDPAAAQSARSPRALAACGATALLLCACGAAAAAPPPAPAPGATAPRGAAPPGGGGAPEDAAVQHQLLRRRAGPPAGGAPPPRALLLDRVKRGAGPELPAGGQRPAAGAGGTPAGGQQPAGAGCEGMPQMDACSVIVVMEEGVTEEQMRQLAAAQGAEADVQVMGSLGMMTLPFGSDRARCCEAYERIEASGSPLVKGVEFDQPMSLR